MKTMGTMQPKFGSDALKGWLIGTGCGVALTLSLALGTGRLVLNETHSPQPVAVVQQAPVVTETGLVPPPIDEYQQYRRQFTSVQENSAPPMPEPPGLTY